MIAISYTRTPRLLNLLENIESLRTKILLTPLSPKSELKYRWEIIIDKIYWTLNSDHIAVTKREVNDILLTHPLKAPSIINQPILSYRKALDLIIYEHLVSEKIVTLKTLMILHDTASRGKFIGYEEDIKDLLTYIGRDVAHPVIQAGIALFYLEAFEPFTQGTIRTAHLLSYVYLYRQGYDALGLLSFDEYLFKTNENAVKIKKEMKEGNMTMWLEYFAEGIYLQLDEIKQKLMENPQGASPRLPAAVFELSDRQRSILASLDALGSRVTNRKVQKLYSVSQITASRDLTKLATLGLLFTHGKGRSVYYTKA